MFPDLLKGELQEQEKPEPLFPECNRWIRSRDGCAAQYQGKTAVYGWQIMAARHQMECEDERKLMPRA